MIRIANYLPFTGNASITGLAQALRGRSFVNTSNGEAEVNMVGRGANG